MRARMRASEESAHDASLCLRSEPARNSFEGDESARNPKES